MASDYEMNGEIAGLLRRLASFDHFSYESFLELSLDFRSALQRHSPLDVLQPAVDLLRDRLQSLGAQGIEGPADARYLLEVERWNGVGLGFLQPDNLSQFGQMLYVDLLRSVRATQEFLEHRLHKGTPYHMLGFLRIYQEDQSGAREYFILAALEDSLTSGERWRREPAAAMLRARWNEASEFQLVERLTELAHTREPSSVEVMNPELLYMTGVGVLPASAV